MLTCDIIIQGAISIITFILGALVAFAQQYFQTRRNRLKERYFELYRPFMRMNQFSYMVDTYPFSEWDFKKQLEVVNLVSDKDYLAPKAMQRMILNFINVTIRMQGDDPVFAEHKNAAFGNLFGAMQDEYIELSKKLHYTVQSEI